MKKIIILLLLLVVSCFACGICFADDSCEHKNTKVVLYQTADCENDGDTRIICKDCGEVINVIITPKSGHNISVWTVTTEPGCEIEGERVGYCLNCGKEFRETVAAAGHSYGDYYLSRKPSCVENGTMTSVCSRCGRSVIKMIGYGDHNYEKKEVIENASLSTPEIYSAVCSLCGADAIFCGECYYKDEKTGISFTSDNGVFEQNSNISISIMDLSLDENSKIKNELSLFSEEFIVYSVKCTVGKQESSLSGYVTVEIPLPESYGRNTGLYLIDSDGLKIEPPAVVDTSNGILRFTTDRLDNFALVNLSKIPQSDEKTENSNIIFYIIIAALVLVLAALAFIIIKKNSNGGFTLHG